MKKLSQQMKSKLKKKHQVFEEKKQVIKRKKRMRTSHLLNWQGTHKLIDQTNERYLSQTEITKADRIIQEQESNQSREQFDNTEKAQCFISSTENQSFLAMRKTSKINRQKQNHRQILISSFVQNKTINKEQVSDINHSFKIMSIHNNEQGLNATNSQQKYKALNKKLPQKIDAGDELNIYSVKCYGNKGTMVNQEDNEKLTNKKRWQKLYQQLIHHSRKSTNYFEVSIQIEKQEVKLCLSQMQRQNLLNLIETKQSSKVDKLLNHLTYSQVNQSVQLQSGKQSMSQQINQQPIEILQERKFNRMRLIGGGGCMSQAKKVTSSEKLDQQNVRLNKQHVSQIQNLKKDTFLVEGDDKRKKVHKTFDANYEKYFTTEPVDEDQIETHIERIIENTLYEYRRNIVSQSIRYKVIDLINLIINYQIIIYSRENATSLQCDIDKLQDKMKILQKYCQENRKLYPCLDLYQYMDILISLNSQKEGLDRANLSKIYKITEQIVKFAKFGAGFLSIAGAIKNLTETDFDELKSFISDLVETVSSALPDMVSLTSDSLDNYYRGNFSTQIYALWMRKVKVMGENLLDPNEEIIFYLEEKNNLKSKDMILFVFMQLNYLLLKQQIQDNLKEFSSKLVKQNKQKLILDFANELQLKEYSNGLTDVLKTLASLIAQSEQFRYIKASILLKLALIIKNFGGITNQEYQSIMIVLCLNYISEKEVSVKIVYQGDELMRDFIHNIDSYYAEILKESQQLKKQMTKFVENDNEKAKIDEITNSIESPEDIPKLLAINLVQMWEISVKQRADQNEIAHKDDALLEAINLYIEQSITHQDGVNVIKNQNGIQQTANDALNQIIKHFLIPNYVHPSNSKDQQANNKSTNSQCKILSILAEGGAGKSMLLKKLEVELLKEKSDYIDDERGQFIPLIIKCNSLDKQNPSVEEFLASQNLDRKTIEILKSSERNKVILLDGYDEYTGEYFKVFSQLKIYDWVNTVVIVTSRLEKISVSDAKLYFNHYDKDGRQGNDDSYTILKLEKISQKDIELYLKKFKEQMKEDSTKDFNSEDYDHTTEMIFKNYNLTKLLKLPINLYLTTRMMVDLNLKDESILKIFKTATDQIEIQELFFQNNFQRQAELFAKKYQKNSKDSQELIYQIKLSYFEYFQAIAMKMYLQKGEVSNFLSTKKESIEFKLREETKQILKANSIDEQLLHQNLNNYIDSRVITRIKLIYEKEQQKEENKNNTESQEFEFRHKSIFEYFAARAIKFDFDLHKENIHKLPLDELQKFNINKKCIMNIGNNNSEQQILYKLFKLIDNDKKNADFTQNYSSEVLEKNNRYFQYLRRASIDKYDQLSSIDIGSSNLLSALFISKFQFLGLTLKKCSLSKLYNISQKHNYVKFEQCNLNNALLKNIKLQNIESSYTNQSFYDSVKEVYSSDNVNNFKSIVFEQDTIFSITKTGCVNKFKLNQKQELTLEKSKQITISPLQKLKSLSKTYVVASAEYTLFFINTTSLEVDQIKIFNDKINNFDCQNNQLIIQLDSNENYFGNFEKGFNQISIKGENAALSKTSDILVTSHQGQLITYKQQANKTFKESQTVQNSGSKFTTFAFCSNEQYLVVYSEDQTCRVLNVLKGFELIKVDDKFKQEAQITFSQNNKYIVSCFQNYQCKIWNIEKGLEQMTPIIDNNYTGSVISMAISSDNKYMAAGYNDSLKILSLENGQQIANTQNFLPPQLQSSTYSYDGQYLATGHKNAVKIWNLEKGLEQIKTLHEQANEILSIAFSKELKYLAYADDKSIKICDIKNDYKVITTLQGQYIQIQFSPDSKYLATVNSQYETKIWNVENGFTISKTIQCPSNTVDGLAFSAKSKYLAIFTKQDYYCHIYNVQEQFEIVKEIYVYSLWPLPIAFSNDDKYFVTGANDSTFSIWHVEKDFELVKKITGDAELIRQIRFSQDGKYLITGATDYCKLWNVQKGFQLVNSIKNKTGEYLNEITFSNEGKYLHARFNSAVYKTWNADSQFELFHATEGNVTAFVSSTFLQNDKYLAINSFGSSSCKIFNVDKGFEIGHSIDDHTQQVVAVACSSDNKFLATASYDPNIKIWNIERAFEHVQTIGESFGLCSVIFSKNGKYLVSGGQQYFKVWNAEKQFEQLFNIKAHDSDVVGIDFSQDSKYLVTFSLDSTCKIWNAEKQFELTKTLVDGSTDRAASIALSKNGKYIAVGFKDRGFSVWNIQNGFELSNTINGHNSEVTSLDFSKDSKYLVSGALGATVKLWNVQQSFSLIHSIDIDCYQLFAVSFSQNDKQLLIATYDYCEVWDAQKVFQLVESAENQKKAMISGDSLDNTVKISNLQSQVCNYIV